MSFKQWSAVIMLAVAALVGAWVVYDGLTGGAAGPASAVAARLLWAGLAMIGLNLAAVIGAAIVAAIVTRKEFHDEAADERDRAIYARSMRNAYFAVSVGGIVTLFLVAFGYDASVAVYAIFLGGTLAGAVGALSQLVYYRIG